MKRVIFLAVALPLLAFGQERPRNPTMLEPPSCAAWLSGPTDEQKRWIQGYMSGLNVLHTIADQLPSNPIDRLGSAEQIYGRISAECQRLGPQANVAMAGVDIFLAVLREALTKPT